MTLLAVAAAGFFGYAAMGLILGHPVLVRLPIRSDRPSRLERRRHWLLQAGATVTPTQFYAVSGAAGLAAFGALAALTQTAAVAPVPAALCAAVPHLCYGRQRKQRLAEVGQAWPDGLRDLIASIGQHLSLRQAILDLAAAGPIPLRQAFRSFGVNARALGVVPALEHVKEELADPASDRILEVLILSAERGSGGDTLSRLLTDLAASITADLRTQAEIETARAEPRINMTAAAGLPWLLLAAMCLIDSPQRAFYASGAGLVPIAVSAALTFAGVLAVTLLSRDPIESRLFVADEGRPQRG